MKSSLVLFFSASIASIAATPLSEKLSSSLRSPIFGSIALPSSSDVGCESTYEDWGRNETTCNGYYEKNGETVYFENYTVSMQGQGSIELWG